MRNKTEEKLIRGFDQITPDCFDDIMKAEPMDISAETDCFQRDASPVAQKQAPCLRHRVRRLAISSGALAAILLCVLFSGIFHGDDIAGHIYIDVNPSIVISLGSDAKVCDIEASNDDGETIIKSLPDENERSHDLYDNISTLVGIFRDQGYIDSSSTDMLISYCYSSDINDTTYTKTSESLKSAIENSLSSKASGADCLYQEFEEDRDIENQAANSGISPGKYRFLSHIKSSSGIDTTAMADDSIASICRSMEKSGAVIDDSSFSMIEGDHSSTDAGSSHHDVSRKRKAGSSASGKTPTSANDSISSGDTSGKSDSARKERAEQTLPDRDASGRTDSENNSTDDAESAPSVTISEVTCSGNGAIHIRFDNRVYYGSHVSVTIRNSSIRIRPEIIRKSSKIIKINADGLDSGSVYEITVRGVRASEHAKPVPIRKQFTYSR